MSWCTTWYHHFSCPVVAFSATNDELKAILNDPKGNAMSWLAGVATILILVLMIWRPGS